MAVLTDAGALVRITKLKSSDSKYDYPMVVAPLMDEFTLNFSNQYDNPFQNLVPSSVEGVVQIVGSGQTLQFKEKYYTFTGASPLKVDLQLEFIPDKSFVLEVKPMVESLIRMATPGAEGGILGMLKTPEADGDISVQIGNQVKLDKCLIEALSITNYKPLLVEGYPSKVIANITILARHLFTKENADRVYL